MPAGSARTIFVASLAILGVATLCRASGAPYLVKDINPGWMGSAPTSMTKVGDRLFFNADDGVHGQELWVTDGTDQGTYMVIDLVPGSDGSVPQWYMADLNGIDIFYADNNDDGFDLYRSDGTAPGTAWLGEVTDGDDPIDEGHCTFSFYYFASTGDKVFFEGRNAAHAYSLWKTDGTPQGTVKLKDLFINEIEAIGSLAFFAGSGSGQTVPGYDLWRSDGTASGTFRLADLRGTILITQSGGQAFFAGEETAAGEELWISDGTVANTRLVKDINPGPNPSTPTRLTDVNGVLYFTAFSAGFGREIWKSDGTESGTQMVIDLVPGAGSGGAYGLTNVDGTLFFARFDSVEGWQLWKSDGTAQGTQLVKVIAPPTVDPKFGPDLFIAANGKLYFSADDGVYGEEVWVSNGESWGTFMIADIDPGIEGLHPDEFIAIGPLLYFSGGVQASGNELWAFDTREPVIPAHSLWGIVMLTVCLIIAGCVMIRRDNRENDFVR